jgi:uncharacterized membrane protein
MYYQIGSILLAILGLILLLSPESLFSKDTSNNLLQKIQEYHQILGGILLGIAYYVYTYTYTPSGTSDFQSTTEKSISETTSVTSVTNVSPPTYDEATS